jgi:uncharacterized tellurite resistance protein B-like protein
MVIHSTFADFVLFVYIHVAHIDNTYDPQELTLIKSKMRALFPEGTDLEKKLYQAIREYNSFDRSKISELCRDSFAKFGEDKETQKSRLYADVNDIINADGTVHELETDVLRKLKKMVDEQVF